MLERGASVWFNAVLRGDNEPIVVGRGLERAGRLRLPHRLRLSADHRRRTAPSGTLAILHGCTIGDGSLVGMGATVLNGAVIGSGVLVGAGALVTEGKAIPDGVLVVGRPARVVRDLTPEEIARPARGRRRATARKMARFRAGLRPAPG